MSILTRHFLGCSADCATLTVQWCRTQWAEKLPPGVVFCLPTALAARRLRDALAQAYGAFQGVRFLMPSHLLPLFAPPASKTLATGTEVLQVWGEVFAWLHEADPQGDIVRWLFPGKDKEWLKRPRSCYSVAQRFITLRTALAEQCLDFGGVVAHSAFQQLEEREQGRWRALDALETRYRELLATHQLVDPLDSQKAILENPQLQEQEAGPFVLVVAGVPDFMPALTTLLDLVPRCDILIQAELSRSEAFDAYGRPATHYWNHSATQLSPATSSIYLAESAATSALVIDQFLDNIATDSHGGATRPIVASELCLGILDRHVMPQLTSVLANHGISVFTPEPIALAERPAARAVKALIELVQRRSHEKILGLLNLPEATNVINVSPFILRGQYNTLVEKHLPQDLSSARAFAEPELAQFITRIEKWIDALRQDPIEGVRAFLTELYGEQTVDQIHDPLLFATFEALHDLLAELSESHVTQNATLELLLVRLKEITLRPIRGSADCSYEGRFEMLWSKGSILIIAGLNETLFPDSVFEDAFLPNNFREQLGLRSDKNRTARDAYILDTLCTLHSPEKSCLICARTDPKGDWFKPSRLLFRCDNMELTVRAKRLFQKGTPRRDVSETKTGLVFAQHPRLWAEWEPKTTLSPSAIKRFLTSPLDYFLSDILRFKTTELLPDGVPAQQFGSLLHLALRTLKDKSQAPAPLLLDALHRAIRDTYGSTPNIEILAAEASAKRRLQSAAQLEEILRAGQWETIAVEESFEMPLNIDGVDLILNGKIDRIDRNAQGTLRIIDYKSGAKNIPNEVHYRGKDDKREWLDFQLPIYELLVRYAKKLPADAPIELAYFTLPSIGQCELKRFSHPTSQADTRAALERTLSAMLHLRESPLSAECKDPLIATLTRPTLPPQGISDSCN
ncbi:MAG: PD-(D/E)XK nuclease family protein [Kiritimatiellia bacterium]